MNFLEQLLTVWRALLANKMRSFLTLLGIIMGVGTIVLLSSLMSGGLAAIGRTVDSASGDDMIKVSVNMWNADGRKDPPLTSADMHALSRATGLQQATVVPQLDARMDAHAHGKDMRVWVVGTNEGALGFYQLELAKGRFLTNMDRVSHRRVAVVGQDVAKTLNAEAGGFGEITIGDERFTVVGVLSKKPTLNVGNRTWNNAVAVPDTTYMAWKGESQIGTILIKTNDLQRMKVTVPLVGHTARAILEARQHPGKTLEVSDSSNKSGGEKAFLGALQILLYAVAILCLGVGGINIMNIMLVTVTERTREIGIRMALGARQKDIRRQFLFEAAAISALGGLLGVAGGIGLGYGISVLLTQILGYWPYMVDPMAVIVAFSSALGTGLVFGWFPARHASKLQPIECLRYE